MSRAEELYTLLLNDIKQFYRKYSNWIISLSIVIFSTIFLVILIFVRLNQVRGRIIDKIVVAENLLYQKKYEEAFKMLNEIISKKTKFTGYALYLKATILYDQKNFMEAKNTCLEALKIKSKKFITLATMYILAQSYTNLGEYDSAINIYNEIIQKFQDSFLLPRIYESLAFCYELKGEIENAKKIYQKLNILYPASYWSSIAQKKLSK